MILLTALALITAGPADFNAKVSAAKPGDIVTLSGDFGIARYNKAKTWSPPVVIDASAATFTSLTIQGVSGVTVRNIAVKGDGKQPGVNVVSSKFVTLLDPHIVGARNAINVTNSTDVLVSGAELVASTADGAQIAGSQRVTVDRLVCYGFVPAPGAHPDCIQWRSGGVYAPLPSSYITIKNVVAIGDLQGVDGFGNTLPADHIVYDNITVMSRFPRGVSMPLECTDCRMTNSRVIRMRGSKYAIQIDPLKLPAGWAAGALVGNSGNTSKP